ncbi:hypothetical protein EB809_07625 [Marinobacter sp. R17]|uniref:PilW family protein n=1 Tax=Marinobacter sp. R17 TaxID=2484250 RepID=UPI000F4CABC3|nr:PilW family protein [Marinobacter sp. R17]ROU00672.1 hypothetical protein EB809_07625 [Marinobacter sp. R17]
MKAKFYCQQGLSLVELMVAITLGLIITAGLVQIFSGNRQSFQLAEANSRVQESGRITSEFMSRAVRNADYWGCIPRGNVANKLDNTDSDYAANADLYDFSDGFMAAQSDGTLGVSGTDIITVRGVGGAGDVVIDEEMPNSSANLKVNTVNGISEGDILLISDCIAGDIFQVTGTQTGAEPGINHNTGNSVSPGNGKPRDGVDVVVNNNCPGNASNCLSKQYNESAQIFRPYYQRYYIDVANGQRSLFRVSGNGATDEIMDGVWDMQVRVGTDPGLSTGAVSNWIDVNSPTALSAAAAENVVAVQISLLVRSPENNVADAPMELCYPGWSDCSTGPNYKVSDEISSDSRQLYRVYTTTATIRNRIDKVEQNEP